MRNFVFFNNEGVVLEYHRYSEDTEFEIEAKQDVLFLELDQDITDQLSALKVGEVLVYKDGEFTPTQLYNVNNIPAVEA